MERLVPKFESNEYKAPFLVTVINIKQFRYSDVRKFDQKRIRETLIKYLSKTVALMGMLENYIKGLNHSRSV